MTYLLAARSDVINDFFTFQQDKSAHRAHRMAALLSAQIPDIIGLALWLP